MLVWFDLGFDSLIIGLCQNKFINVCLKDMSVIGCLGLYKENHSNGELGFVCHTPERKHQPHLLLQEEQPQQQDSPQLCFITNLSLIWFYPTFGE